MFYEEGQIFRASFWDSEVHINKKILTSLILWMLPVKIYNAGEDRKNADILNQDKWFGWEKEEKEEII